LQLTLTSDSFKPLTTKSEIKNIYVYAKRTNKNFISKEEKKKTKPKEVLFSPTVKTTKKETIRSHKK